MMHYQLDVALSPILEHFRTDIEATIKPAIELIPEKNHSLTLWQSKLGGLPYLPKKRHYPHDNQGNPLYLLAQINWHEVPQLTDFPSKGILQFYIAAGDTYGLDFDNPKQQNGFRIVYFPEVETDETQLISDFSFLPPPTALPFGDISSALQFKKVYLPVDPSAYEFEHSLEPKILAQLTEAEQEDLLEEYGEKLGAQGHKLGGYPYFTQEDPRSLLADGHDYQLLLQIDTDDNLGIMWGDAGVGHFFIKTTDLRKLDFSQVLYNWDCL